MYDFIIEVGHSIWKNGLSLSALGTAIFVLLRQKKVKRKLKKLIPMLFDDDSEVKEYVSNQVKIMENQRLIMNHLGVNEWNAEEHALTGNLEKSLLISSQGDISRAVSVAGSTHRMKTLLRLGRKNMREYLKKLGSRKFQALLTSLVVNIVSGALFAFGVVDIDEVINTWMPIINMTIGTISTWVYIIVEGGVDKAKAGGTNYDYTGLETESKSAGTVESTGDSGYNRSAS